jgi:DNA-binding MarR family transcriptional regulator
MPRKRNDDVLRECALFDIQRASRVVSGLYNAHLRPSGITVAQFSLLRSIDALAPVGMVRLAGAMAMDRTSVTRIIEPLLERGLIRGAAADDRRVRNIELTPRGRAAIVRARRQWDKAQRELLEVLGRPQWLAMRKALRTTVKRVRSRGADA